MKKFNYYTQDGHLMLNGEIMWRICCSDGELFLEPVSLIFSEKTGYNNFNINLNPFAANHLHYYSYDKALKELNERKLLK
jgi:hypothetical protein